MVAAVSRRDCIGADAAADADLKIHEERHAHRKDGDAEWARTERVEGAVHSALRAASHRLNSIRHSLVLRRRVLQHQSRLQRA